MTAVTADAAAGTVVNGPKDALDWYGTDRDQAGKDVRRLRQRIFAASQAGDLKKVRNLQRLMLRSRANALVSVRRVAEVNAGRETPGIDGRVVLMASRKAGLAGWCQRRSRLWTARPVRRVLIPKPGSAKKRAPGIPVIAGRALQAMTPSRPSSGPWRAAGPNGGGRWTRTSKPRSTTLTMITSCASSAPSPPGSGSPGG